jgi:hypothetical protein
MDLKLKAEIDAMKQELKKRQNAETDAASRSSVAAQHNHPSAGMTGQIPNMEVGAWRRGPAILGAVILIVMGVMGSLAFASQGVRTPSVDTFASCQSAGNPVIMTYPRQCQLPDGRVFHE